VLRRTWLFIVLVWAVALGCANPPTPSSSSPPFEAASLPKLLGMVPAADFRSCLGEKFEIDFLDAMEAIPDDNAEAQLDQIRDWVWTAVLGRLSIQSSDDALLSGLSDRPLRRDAGFAHLLRMPVGPTRAAGSREHIGIVLVLGEGEAERRDDALEALDEVTFEQGAPLTGALIYNYSPKLDRGVVDVCILGKLDGAQLTSAATGYRQGQITSKASLAAFLDGGVDLLSAECKADGLHATGRARSRTKSRPLTYRHVTELAQRPEPTNIPLSALGIAPSSIDPELRRNAVELGAQLDRYRKDHSDDEIANAAEGEMRAFLKRVLSWKSQHPEVATHDLILSLRLQLARQDSRGFSLDPRIDVAQARRALADVSAAFADPAALVGLLETWKTPPRQGTSIVWTSLDPATRGPATAALSQLRRAVDQAGAFDAEGLILSAAQDMSPASAVASMVMERSQYQCARYDGPFRGTETGMTYFYTDFVAKLWALDWHHSSPETVVPGFASVVSYPVSTVFCHEEQRPYTRLWFGMREEGYDKQGDRVSFAPLATRLFAKGSQQGPEHSQEQEPQADMLRFLRWWDMHYRSVAEWEPEYERLNQIQKWSAVVAAASESCLSFLASESVSHDERFDRWIAAHPELRFKGPVPLVDHPGETTECIDLYGSAPFDHCGQIATLSGGISSLTKQEWTLKPSRHSIAAPELGHLSRNATPTVSEVQHVRYDRVERAGGALRDFDVRSKAGTVETSATVESKISARGDSVFWGAEPIPDSASRKAKSDPSEKQTLFGRARDWTTSWVKRLVVDRSKGTLTGREEMGGFGIAHVTAADLASARPKVTAESLELSPEKVQRRVVQKMVYDGATFPAAVQSLAVDHEVLELNDGSYAVRLSKDGDARPVYGVMSSGGGNKGPPSDLKYVLGVPEEGSGRHKSKGPKDAGPGKGARDAPANGSRPDAISVTFIAGHAAELEIAKRKGHRVQATAPSVAPLLKAGQFEKARELALAPNAASTIVTEVTASALDTGRFDDAKTLLSRERVAGLSHEDKTKLLNATLRAQVKLRGDALAKDRASQLAGLSDMTIRLALRAPIERRTAERVLHPSGLHARQPGVVYAPPDYPAGAGLPPAFHRAEAPPPPESRYILQLLPAPIRKTEAPREVDAGGRKLLLRAGPGTPTDENGPKWNPGPSSPGPAYWLLAAAGACALDSDDRDAGADAGVCDSDVAWPIGVIVPCRIAGERGGDESLPSCSMEDDHEPEDQREWRTLSELVACREDRACVKKVTARYELVAGKQP
jgi:hypothetical protein